MRITWQFVMFSSLTCLLSSCAPLTPEEHFVRQKISIEIHSDKTVTVEIHHLSGYGWNDVGIRCSPEIWNTLTNGTKNFTVKLIASNKNDTKIAGVSLVSGDPYFLGRVPNVHYLFLIGGEYKANATVEITFPNTPTETTHAEIIVGKTPADTGL